MSSQIRILREKRGWTQAELAEQSGISKRTIQRLESGESEPKGHTLKCLIQTFGSDWQEDGPYPEQIQLMNMLCLTFMLIPFGNLILPTIIWLKHKNMPTVNQLGRHILNFQISWYLGSAALSVLLIWLQRHTAFKIIFWGIIGMAVINIVFIFRAAKKIRQQDDQLYPSLLRIL